MILGVSFDTAGERAAGTFARSAEPSPIRLTAGDAPKLARATYPLLRDEQHVVAELYDITNVPVAVWIDENGRVVRPPEPAGTYDVVKHMDPATFTVPEEILKRAGQVRTTYFDAVRDWVKNGAKSRFAFSPEQVAAHVREPGDASSRGHACFALAAWLWRNGQREASKRWFDAAVEAQPDNWTFRRQKIAVADDAAIGNFAATPEFFQTAKRQVAEGKRYYDLIDMPGMPSE